MSGLDFPFQLLPFLLAMEARATLMFYGDGEGLGTC